MLVIFYGQPLKKNKNSLIYQIWDKGHITGFWNSRWIKGKLCPGGQRCSACTAMAQPHDIPSGRDRAVSTAARRLCQGARWCWKNIFHSSGSGYSWLVLWLRELELIAGQINRETNKEDEELLIVRANRRWAVKQRSVAIPAKNHLVADTWSRIKVPWKKTLLSPQAVPLPKWLNPVDNYKSVKSSTSFIHWFFFFSNSHNWQAGVHGGKKGRKLWYFFQAENVQALCGLGPLDI